VLDDDDEERERKKKTRAQISFVTRVRGPRDTVTSEL